MEIRPAGRHALLVEVEDAAQARSLAAYVVSAGLEVREVVPAARTVLLDGTSDAGAVSTALSGWAPGESSGPGPLVELSVTYDGPDLAMVAGVLGCSVEALVARHLETTFTAEFAGFSPGFAYLSGWTEVVPRRDVPRTRVAPGSVALADRWCAVYPAASPGGWQVIGHTDEVLWDAAATPPALIEPGARVRFVEAPR